jgi:hypothetical protein
MSKKLEKVLDSRQEEYGDAVGNFTKIGIIWGALLDIGEIEPHQVALMMDALKTVRCFDNPSHKDSWLDKQGYTQHGFKIAELYEPRG